ncbi:hypothetical protein OCK74_11490 [Chitinophagaceae bacterium LB-8]|uniref:Pyrrolo-quinoline quinone repeat domain-containing protein n=1 Tax=Paraflavisolibacter caeni TaxID=2982496 RepID=A0A9X3BHJ3_9BACT|nr:hypothetical protein [Paraflavisolibacter caeni]MCU7549742.1 hypothetical protein [Paraflavisolibacter caeni]
MLKIALPVLFILFTCFISCKDSISLKSLKKKYSGWSTYAGSKEGIRYSSNEQITVQNVSQLQVAWVYS